MNWWLIVLGALLLAYPTWVVARMSMVAALWLVIKVAQLMETRWGFVAVAAALAAAGAPTILRGLGVL